MSIRRQTLDRNLDRLLSRMVPPRGLGDQAQQDETAALSRALDRMAPGGGYEAWWERFEDALLGIMTTRAWPTVGEVTKAGKSIGFGGSDQRASGEPPQLYDWIREWWLRHHDCPRHLKPQEHHSRRLVADRLATWGELWRRGFPVPRELVRAAKEEPDPKHQGIMEDLQAMGRRIRGEEIEPLDKRFAGDWKQAKAQVQP